MTLFQFYKAFDTEQKCLDYLSNIRWGAKAVCPSCGHDRHYVIQYNKSKKREGAATRFKCANNKCYHRFSVTSGTIFHSANVPLWQFFYLIFSSAINKKNVSSVQNGANLGVTQKTSWYIMMRIRMLCYQDDNLKLDGEVEVDETYLAKNMKWKYRNGAEYERRWKRGNASGRKIPVLGIIQRDGGKVIVRVIPNKNRKIIQGIILKHIETGSALFTDSAAYYINLDSYYLHEMINHKEGEYVRGNVHTNTIESFWANLRKAIIGTHGAVGIPHLQRYCDEVAYRWNMRGLSPMERFNDLLKRGCTMKPISQQKTGALKTQKCTIA